MKNSFARLFGGNKSTESVQEQSVTEQVRKIPLRQIVPNKYQPRMVFAEEKIEELARTIHTHGVIQPIVVRTIGPSKYEIIAGERRYRAMKFLEWTEVPAIVRELDDRETASIALIENLQREELTPIEEAEAYAQLLTLHRLTQEALAQRLGKSQSTIANKMRLLKLPEVVQTAILEKKIAERQARALLVLKEEEQQLLVFEKLVAEHWNTKQVEEYIQLLQAPPVVKKRKKQTISVSRDVRIAINTIKQSLQLVEKSGVAVQTEEEDSEDYVTITVRIPKKS